MTRITVNANGPLRIEGEFEICDASGKSYGLGGRTTVSLCRCGHSQNRPFCDGSHRGASFSCQPQARDLPPKA